MSEPHCPYCYDGIIVNDDNGNFFCNICFKDVKIRKYSFLIEN